MAFASFLGRVLFASIFILSAYQAFTEFGVDGGPAAKALKPKIKVFTHLVTSKVGIQVPEIDVILVVQAAIFLKGAGGLLFILGSYAGAFFLLLHQLVVIPILYDFYNYDANDKEFTELFTKFTQNMALSGALLFFIGMKHSLALKRPRKISKTKTH